MLSVSLQAQVVFNKTEHDYGHLASQSGVYEHDFIFRNTTEESVFVLNVSSIQPSLSFVHTRSEVLPGEYGFVKTKLKTDTAVGLIHDEVYVTLAIGTEAKTEIIYLRALVEEGGQNGQNREFEDGIVATSVEVSPSDIRSMEGLLSENELEKAENEIAFLRQQIDLKTEIIAQLSDDLQVKAKSEAENMAQLKSLELILKSDTIGNSKALAEVEALSTRLQSMKENDSLMKVEVASKQHAYELLVQQSDSAKNYAEKLSQELAERFESEARAIEKSEQLEASLSEKEQAVARNKAQIDSLNLLVSMSSESASTNADRIEDLSVRLAWKEKENELQEEHSKHQQKKIAALKREKEQYAFYVDSLTQTLSRDASSEDELRKEIHENNTQIALYEKRVDSLKALSDEALSANQASSQAIVDMEEKMAEFDRKDSLLKASLSEQADVISALQSESGMYADSISNLQSQIKKQSELASEMKSELVTLSEKEASSLATIDDLNAQLTTQQARESEALNRLQSLQQELKKTELSNQKMTAMLESKNADVDSISRIGQKTRMELQQAQLEKTRVLAKHDSVSNALTDQNAQLNNYTQRIEELESSIAQSDEKRQDHVAQSIELEKRLKTAELSNEIVFDELKGEIEVIVSERDMYRDANAKANLRIAELERALLESKRKETSAVAFAEEMRDIEMMTKASQDSDAKGLVYKVCLLTSETRLNLAERFHDVPRVREYAESGRYRYATGSFKTVEEAKALRDKLKERGYSLAYVIAFHNGKKIPLKEALEMASL